MELRDSMGGSERLIYFLISIALVYFLFIYPLLQSPHSANQSVLYHFLPVGVGQSAFFFPISNLCLICTSRFCLYLICYN